MKQRGYLSYLVRLWQTCDGEGEIWRASVESPGTGERRCFADIEGLFAFLLQEIASQRLPNPKRNN